MTEKQDQQQIEALNSDDVAKADFVISDARDAFEGEKGMTLWQGIRLYPKAIAWSIILSSALIMEGYDTALLVCNFHLVSFA
jgi:hypothetical protein